MSVKAKIDGKFLEKIGLIWAKSYIPVNLDYSSTIVTRFFCKSTDHKISGMLPSAGSVA